MLETNTVLQNRYRIERQIGSGGMGAVYLAVDERFGSFVAIKETFYKADELGEAFEREARLLNSLHHPTLPHVSDYFTEDDGHFLVMQFIEGEDLFETLKRDGAFALSDVTRWTESLLDALEYLHSQNPPIIHRDIKPQNLKITARGDIVLLDFGLAKLNSDDNSGMKSVFGYSRRYSPLEQIQGTGTDARSDLFALAATVYHLLTGTPPLEALTRAAAIVNGEPDPLPPVTELNHQIPVQIGNVLTVALALNASRRFVSAAAMRQAFSHAANADTAAQSNELPERTTVVSPIENLVSIAPETESFPALDAFAATISGAADEAEAKEFSLERVEIMQPNSDKDWSATKASDAGEKKSVIKEEIFSSPETISTARSNNSKKQYAGVGAAFLVLFISIGAAAWFYGRTGDSKSDSKEIPAASAAPDAVSGSDTIVETAPTPGEQTTDPANTAVSSPTKKQGANKTVKNEPAAAEKNTAGQEVVNRVAEPEKPKSIQKTISVQPETRRSENRKPAPVGDSGGIQTPAPVNTAGEVPDIESVFTGRSSQNKVRKRQSPDGMTSEELEEFRRIRREERKRRRNQPVLPPF